MAFFRLYFGYFPIIIMESTVNGWEEVCLRKEFEMSGICKTIEDMRNETILRERRKIAYSLLKIGKLSYEEIAICADLAIEEIKAMAAQKGIVNV